MVFKGTHANLGGIMNRALVYEKRYGRGGKDKMGKFFSALTILYIPG